MRKGPLETLIRATCQTCGDVELLISDVQVLLCATTNEGTYVFRCPSCRLAVSKPADGRTIDVLIAAGVELVVWDLPAELDEHHGGPPISYDDLIDFHFLLESGAAEAAVAGSGFELGARPADGPRCGRAGR